MGMATTVPDGMSAGSDVANLSMIGVDPKSCYTGRSPLEAVSIGVKLGENDVTYRCNLVTLSSEEGIENKTMVDYSAGEISTEEAKELIEYLAKEINSDVYKLYAGISYRHCLVIDNGKVAGDFTPPHDITGKPVKDHLPTSEEGKKLLAIMEKSYNLLKDHPVNKKRIQEGKRPANSLWFWGEGTKPALQDFTELNGVKGGMISAVDLLKGIAILSDIKLLEVDGATGNYDTNFTGKANACLQGLKEGLDYVYIHMEAPDECGHHGDAEHKIWSIAEIDKKVVKPIVDELNARGEHFRMLICPDHPTPLSIMTHVSDPVPYLLYRSGKVFSGVKCEKYTEDDAKSTGIFIPDGVSLMKKFIG
jgi:2,3-bisphosphoglycerate-independent phosphoglycerate mutase